MKQFTAVIALIFLATVSALAQDTAKSKDPWKNTRAGNGLYKTKDYKGAEQKYRDALKTDTSSPVVNHNLGNSLYEQKKYSDAADAYDDAIRNSTGNDKAKAYYNKGNALYQQGDLEGSADAYKEALRIDPKNEDARYNLAMTQKMIKAKKQGLKDTTGNFKNDPNGKFLKKDSAGDKMIKEKNDDKKKKDGDKDKNGSQPPLDPKKQSMSPDEAKKVMSALKDSEQKTRQRINQNGNGSWYQRSRDKDW